MQAVLMRLKAIETGIPVHPPQPALAMPKPTPPPVIEPPRDLQPKPTVHVPSYMQSTPVAPMTPRLETPAMNTVGQSKPYSAPAKDADEIEYKFGINGLLRGGAVVMLCAVLSLVAIALNRHWITPTMQFVGELLLCFGFIGVGIWKHEEREDFGKLMVGIGSFGIYASLAGAHLFKHLITSEALISLLAVHSFANLGYSAWRASKSFLSIGMIGGLITAVLPVSKHNYPVDLALHFMILVPIAAIVIRKKWMDMSVITWTASTLALLPVATSSFNHDARMWAIHANTLLMLLTCGLVYRKTEFDGRAAMQSVILAVGGVMAIAVDSGTKGSLHELGLAAAAVAVGFALQKNETVRNSTWFGASLIATILAPISLHSNPAMAVYAVEALVFSALLLKFRWDSIAVNALAALGLSLGAYLWTPPMSLGARPPILPWQEGLALASYSATVVLLIMYAIRKQSKDLGDVALLVGGSMLTAFFVRGFALALGYQRSPLSTLDLWSLGLAIASVVAMIAGNRLRRWGATALSAFVFIIAGVLAVVREPSNLPLWLSPVMISLIAVSVIVGTRSLIVDQDENFGKTMVVTAGVILSALFVRGFEVTVALPWTTLTASNVDYAGIMAANLALTVYALARRGTASLVLGWGSFLIAAVSGILLQYSSEHLVWLEHATLALPILSLITLYAITPRDPQSDQIEDSFFVIGLWALATFFIRQILIMPSVGVKEVAALTISWVMVAVAVIAMGFILDRRYLRYWSLAIFMITVGKVFLIDLAETDAVVRVVMLMLLGLGMVGGGYWYIVWRRKNTVAG